MPCCAAVCHAAVSRKESIPLGHFQDLGTDPVTHRTRNPVQYCMGCIGTVSTFVCALVMCESIGGIDIFSQEATLTFRTMFKSLCITLTPI